MKDKIYLALVSVLMVTAFGILGDHIEKRHHSDFIDKQNAAYGAIRTYNSSVRPWRRLALEFNSNANIFPTADPSPAGTPLSYTSAMGKSTGDGSVTIALTNGFTAPCTFTVYYWQIDSVTPANSCWVRLAPSATGTNIYQTAVDTNYALFQFSMPENTPWIVKSSSAVTGPVYTDSPADPNNPNSSAAGFSTGPG